jgi:hypothetical protein
MDLHEGMPEGTTKMSHKPSYGRTMVDDERHTQLRSRETMHAPGQTSIDQCHFLPRLLPCKSSYW